MTGKVISVYGGVFVAGRNQVITLNRGRADGLESGHVLVLRSAGTVLKDRNDNGKPVQLPSERNGLMFVFRVFEHVSYALVVNSPLPVAVGDLFTQP